MIISHMLYTLRSFTVSRHLFEMISFVSFFVSHLEVFSTSQFISDALSADFIFIRQSHGGPLGKIVFRVVKMRCCQSY